MSDNIPLELQDEIIKRVPVKSLLKFRCVSKQWKSLIDSPDFAADYCGRRSRPPHRLLIRYIPFEQNDTHIPKYKYVSIADDDDDTFQHYHIPSTTVPQSVNNLRGSRIVGSSDGLFCLYGYDVDRPFPYDYRDRSYMAVFWNPCIRKFVDVPVPNVLFQPYNTVLGFGVCPRTKDPKIVKINSFHRLQIHTSGSIPCRVQVFSLRSGTWKSPSCGGNKLPCRNSISFSWSQVVVDGVIYWLAYELIIVEGGFRHQNLIMSFDLSSEGFEEVFLPDNLARLRNYQLSISKRMESVVVLEAYEDGTSYGVWIMGQGVTKLFTKLFTVMPRVPPYCVVRGFTKNGEPVIDHESHALFAYDRYSERIKDLRIVGQSGRLSVQSYMETLLLIDQ